MYEEYLYERIIRTSCQPRLPNVSNDFYKLSTLSNDKSDSTYPSQGDGDCYVRYLDVTS